VADSTLAVFYNPRQPYRRSDLAGRGDHCEWLSVSPALLLEANPRLGDFGERFFPGTHALLAAPLCMRVRRIAHGALQGAHEPLRIEESLMRVIEGCCADRARGSRAGQGATARGRDRIQEAKALLAARLGERLALGEVAGKLGVSPYYLCRAFRAHTGTTLHGYRNELRLRAALEHLLERCDDLTRLALDLGFSSHSHFTAAFRRKFGTTPSRFRPGKRPT
jgi:AraC-like DNA-binding protein